MKREYLIRQIRKYDPVKIYFYENRIIDWIDDYPILIDHKLLELSDNDINDLYTFNFLVND